MSDTDESLLSPAARAALAALEACTLAELGAIGDFHLRRIKRAVAVREAAVAGAMFNAEVERINRAKAVILPHLRVVPKDDGLGGLELWPAGALALPESLRLVDPYASEAEPAVSDPIPFELAQPDVIDGKLVPDEDDQDESEEPTTLEPTAAELAEAQAWFAREQGQGEPQ